MGDALQVAGEHWEQVAETAAGWDNRAAAQAR